MVERATDTARRRWLQSSEANAYCTIELGGRPIVVLNYNFVGIRKLGFFLNLYGATRDHPGAAYLPMAGVGGVVSQIRAECPDAFILLVVHAGRALAPTLHATKVNYQGFERLGAHCVVFHHSHTWLGTATGRSFFLGDFVFDQTIPILKDRLGGFLELCVNPDDNSYKYITYTYRFYCGYPMLETSDRIERTVRGR